MESTELCIHDPLGEQKKQVLGLLHDRRRETAGPREEDREKYTTHVVRIMHRGIRPTQVLITENTILGSKKAE